MVSLRADVRHSSLSEREGTSEFAWRQCYYLMGLTELSLGDPDLAVVLSPHPHDELFGLGGTISLLLSRGTTVIVVTASDGETSEVTNDAQIRDKWRRRRRSESRDALSILGKGQKGNVLNVQLHYPDGRLAGVEADLGEHLHRFLGPNDLCLAPWELDGDLDVEASGRAARSACQMSGARLLQYPLGMWHWANPDDETLPWRGAQRVSLGADDLHRKRLAIQSYGAKVRSIGGTPDDGTPLASSEIAHFERSFEVFFS